MYIDSVVKTKAFQMEEEQLYDFCNDNDHLKIEKNADGEVIIMTPPNDDILLFKNELYRRFHEWNNFIKKGKVLNLSKGYKLFNNAIYFPDLCYLSAENYSLYLKESNKEFSRISPDFVVEIKTSGTSLSYLMAKMNNWLQNGTSLGWLIDAGKQKVYIYRKDHPVKIIKNFGYLLSNEDILPGFTIKMDEVLGSL